MKLMPGSYFFIPILMIIAGSVLFIACHEKKKWSVYEADQIRFVKNEDGPLLGYSLNSGVVILTSNGFAFKDLNKNGRLDDYEDWRLPVEDRARDLAGKLTNEQIIGLMMYSSSQSIPSGGRGPLTGTYGGKSFRESGAEPNDLSDQQIGFLRKDHIRHVLITRVRRPEIGAAWNNKAQALAESTGMGIPVNNSSGPRHEARSDAIFMAGAQGEISRWPGSLGLAATFDPSLVRDFGSIASQEYRAMGITTALSPQVDLATEPRWDQVYGSFGEDPLLVTDMARAYIDGFQTSGPDKIITEGWGYESVNVMVKHWPGGGTGEGGRDARYGYGKYTVYPGNNFGEHLIPFVEGAFELEGGTRMASAIMPHFSISYGQAPYGENMGNAFSSYIITDLLRMKFNFEGVVCTDWNVMADAASINQYMSGKCWGVEDLSVAERHYKSIMAGVDQFNGTYVADPLIEAFDLGVNVYGEDFMRVRFEKSAYRLLLNIFRVGLFENAYLDVESSSKIAGNPDFMNAGYQAQIKSIVLLKNWDHVLPIRKRKTVFVPKRLFPAERNYTDREQSRRWDYPVNMSIISKYFNFTDNPDDADFALVFIESPRSGSGYQIEDAKRNGGNGYFPISLQYGPYIAASGREESIAGGDPLERFINRSYKDKSVITANEKDANLVQDTKTRMKGKPVIVSLNVKNPTILKEFESSADAILIDFDVQLQAILDIINGRQEPSGLLPFQMPADMESVEKQFEDVPHDMECHVDTSGNLYDFGFGMNWSGVIKDERTNKYKR